MEVGMVSRVGVVSDDFRKQVLGYGLTTAEILYRMPDHPSLLQTYVWQNYDLSPKFPAIARGVGLHFVYTGNVHDETSQSTYCPRCIGRDRYDITTWRLTWDGRCRTC